MSEKTLEVEIPYEPQSYQDEIHSSQSRFRVVVIGRRGGKTELALNELIDRAMSKPGLYWYVAPSYKQAKQIAWKRLKALLKNDPYWKFNEVELSGTHRLADTTIELKGADNEDSLRGVGLNGIVLDEYADFKPNVWPEVIRPMLTDTKGWALFIGTPRGKNHFYDLFRVRDDKWRVWQYPTAVNGFIDEEEIKESRKGMSDRQFRQEHLAEFLDDSSGVFRGIRACSVGELKPPEVGRYYVIGADLAKHEDFTVLTAVDSSTREVVAWDRFQDVRWPEQKLRIQELAKRYNNAKVMLDATGVGDPILDDLQDARVSVEGYKFTSESKEQLIEQLIVAIEQRLITFPPIPELIFELERFGIERTPGGKIKYTAPLGFHDDCVISLGLAVWGMRSFLKTAQVIQDGYEESPVDRQGMGESVIEEYEQEEKFGLY